MTHLYPTRTFEGILRMFRNTLVCEVEIIIIKYNRENVRRGCCIIYHFGREMSLKTKLQRIYCIQCRRL